MKKLLMMTAVALACAAPAAAQPEPSASEMEAARELLVVSRSHDNFIRGMELGMEAAGMGELTPAVRTAVREFMDEHFRFEDLEPEMARMYADLYTEDEIRQMSAFYRTPLGQRMIETLPELAAASQRIAQEHLQDVMPELIQRLMEVMEEEESGPAPES